MFIERGGKFPETTVLRFLSACVPCKTNHSRLGDGNGASRAKLTRNTNPRKWDGRTAALRVV